MRFSIQERIDALHQIRFTGFALPYREHVPSRSPESLFVFSIPPLVPLQFRTPVFRSGPWDVGDRAVPVLMPETALDLDDLR